MRQRIVTQPHGFVGYWDSIQFQQHNASAAVVRILNRDLISGVLETVSQAKARPFFRDDRVNRKCVAAASESQNFFEPDAIGPSRCACVPSPATDRKSVV